MFRFAPEIGRRPGGVEEPRQCPQSPVWMVPALQELFEAWCLGQEQSCARPRRLIGHEIRFDERCLTL